MKKHLLIAAAAVAVGAFAASAQMSVVKEAERALKANKSPEEVIALIKPAFSNPETENDALTYVIPGKAYFAQYDDLNKKKLFMKDFPENGNQMMAEDLINGYDYFMKALAVDTVVNAKGKVEHKYSKEIVNTIIGSAPYFFQSAAEMYSDKNYEDAYKLFGIFASIYDQEPLMSIKKADPAYSIPEVYYNQGIAAWQDDNLPNALKAFTDARKAGYTDKQLFDYALNIANTLNDKEAIFEWATAGNEAYGTEDASYLGNIINVYLQEKNFDKAFETINAAIAVDPNNAQYYIVKGVLFDNQDNLADAKAMFKQAVDLAPEDSRANTLYGYILQKEAYMLNDAMPTNLSVAESSKYVEEKIKPLFLDSAKFLEKAWSLDNNNTEALGYLQNVYYSLNDEAKLQDVQDRMDAARNR